MIAKCSLTSEPSKACRLQVEIQKLHSKKDQHTNILFIPAAELESNRFDHYFLAFIFRTYECTVRLKRGSCLPLIPR